MVRRKIPKNAITKVEQELKLEQVDEFGKPLYIRCKCCNKIMAVGKFVKDTAQSSKTGYYPICKECCAMMSLNENGNFDKNKVYELCKMVDKPFINNIFEKADDKKNSRGFALNERGKIGIYWAIIGSRGSGFMNTTFANGEKPFAEVEETDEIVDIGAIKEAENNIELWGEGFTPNEYKQLNKKYNLLLNNYPLRTEMHKEMLVKYCKYSLREEIAIAQGNTADAKYWGELAMKTATNAKINPSQLSSSDLSDGITSFSKLSEVVEKAQDIIPMLNTFRQKPTDLIDYAIYLYVDSVAWLTGLPPVEYKEIYQHFDKRYEENKNKYKFLKKEDFTDFDDELGGE